jgi:hypothetical protein
MVLPGSQKIEIMDTPSTAKPLKRLSCHADSDCLSAAAAFDSSKEHRHHDGRAKRLDELPMLKPLRISKGGRLRKFSRPACQSGIVVIVQFKQRI